MQYQSPAEKHKDPAFSFTEKFIEKPLPNLEAHSYPTWLRLISEIAMVCGNSYRHISALPTEGRALRISAHISQEEGYRILILRSYTLLEDPSNNTQPAVNIKFRDQWGLFMGFVDTR